MIRNLGQVAAIYIGSSAPRNTNLIWLDNTVVPFVFRAYDGSAWSELATHKWVRAYVDGWLVTLPPRQLADDGDYMLINSNNVNYKITVKDFVKSAVGNPLDFKGIIRVSADFPNPSTLEAGDMYVIITSPVGGSVTDPYSGKTFEDSEKIVWDEVTRSWESLGKINITVNLTTSYSETEVTIHSSAGKETTIQGATDQLAGVMLPGQYSWLQALSNGSIVPGDPSPLTPLTPAHKHNYSDIINRLVSQQGTGESTIDPMSQKATTDALNLKFDKASVLQVSGAATDKVMSQKAVTDALKTLSDDFNNKLTNYLPLVGGTMKGSIRFPAESGIIGNADGTRDTYILRSFNNRLDIGSAALSTRIISNASDLLHHRSDTSYKIWDAYNLTNPVTYTTNTYNHATLTNKDGQYFTYIKAGTNGLLPHSKATLVSGGSGSLGTSDQSFNAAYINNLHTNKVTFGDAGSFIDNQSGDSSHIGIGFYASQNAGCPIYAGSLCVSSGYANDAPRTPINGIYSKGQVRTNASMMVGQSSNVTFGQLGYGINYGNSLADGVGSEYSTGATLLFHFINPNQGNIGYIAPTSFRAGNFIPTYLKLFGGKAILGVGKNIDYNAGDSVTVTEYILLHQGNSFYLGVPTTYVPVRMPEDKAALASGNGYLEWWNPGAGWVNHRAGKYIVNGGSSSQFLKGDGSLDSTAYLPLTGGTVTGQVIFNSYGLAFQNNAWSNDLVPNRTYSGYLQVLDAYGASSAGGPTNYGTVLQVNSRNAHWANQLWFSSLGLYHRHMAYNQTEYSDWTKLATTSDLGNYLPLTGGTLSGNLTINTVGSTTLVINNNDTNGSETFMRVLRKGTASAAIGFRDSLGAYIYNYNSNKYLFIDNDGYARVGTTSGSTRLALITDIPTVSGYLPLTGGTLTGTLSINSGGSEPLIINNSASAGEAYVVTKTQGTTRGVMGWNSSLGMFLQDNRGYTFSVKADGVYFGASSSTLTKLPTSTDLSNYLPLTGGNLTGKLSIKASGSNLLILDSSSSTESVIHFLRSSTTKGAVGYYDNIGAFIYNFPSNTYLFVKDDGKPYVGTRTNYKKILTETDITGYATQSWVNNQGYLTSHQTIYNLTFQAGTFAAKTFDPNGAAATVNIPTNTSHLTNDSGFITSSALNGYATQAWVNSQNFVKSTSTKKVTDIQPVDALPATQVSGVLYLVFG